MLSALKEFRGVFSWFVAGSYWSTILDRSFKLAKVRF